MSTKTLHIDIFTDYVCPWCYLSSAAVEKLCQEYPVEISWIPFPLHPETPDSGLALNDLFQGRNMDSMHADLYQRMDQAGLEYCDRTMTYNSRLAQELGQWADTQPGGKEIHKALYRAYFVHNQNLAQKSVLLKVVKDVGLDVELASEVLETRSFSQVVDDAWSFAKEFQITGVPCFVANNHMLPGCHPYEELENFVKTAIAAQEG